ncbi:hypothetical protein ACET3Z_018011 [Daucus carota]
MFNDAYISLEWKDTWKEWNVDIWWVVWLGYRKELGIKEMPQAIKQNLRTLDIWDTSDMGHFVTWSKKDDEASRISRKVDRALANCKCFGSLPLSESEVEFTPRG